MSTRDLATNRSGTYVRLPRVVQVQPLEGFRVHLTFSDGLQKEVDLEPYLRSPLFEPIRSDLAYFRKVRVDIETIAWPNGLDIAPETLYYDGAPPWVSAETTEPRAASGRRPSVQRRRSPIGSKHRAGQKARGS